MSTVLLALTALIRAPLWLCRAGRGPGAAGTEGAAGPGAAPAAG